MPKIDSVPFPPTVSRISDAFVEELATGKLDEAHVEGLSQADHLSQTSAI